jgi:hypothetical protein
MLCFARQATTPASTIQG